ncbi:uncharacterized protein LOC134693557 [Mytilus trossulus]|uniref:uncharacterized protein LOC134693557 n=1 Tax=Mytilus trossulus TaxID=6551 RepID=UPI003006B1CB
MFITYLAVIYSCFGSVYLDYIYYKNLDRRCLPYYDCPPGHEILPCSENFQKDICHKCNKGYKQPDLISSTGWINETKCFKPISHCLAHDITYSRNKYQNAFCDSVSGCKCNTYSCFYGDPCLCVTKPNCGIGKTLTDSGDCVPCPVNTYKHDTGCGPCRRINQRTAVVIHSTQQPLYSERSTLVFASISPQCTYVCYNDANEQ